MTLTVAQARTAVSGHLDDDGTRWTATAGGDVDLALGAAISACLSDMVGEGIDRFDEQVSATSTTAGVVDLSSYDPLDIRGVALIHGSAHLAVQPEREELLGAPDTTPRSLAVRIVRNLGLGITDGAALFSTRSTKAIDHWVCARAALHCAVKDAERRPELESLEVRMREEVMRLPRIPGGSRFPRRRGSTKLRWVWRPSVQHLVLGGGVPWG